MTYTKPEDITYTQIAIWIDENAYKADCDQLRLYEYLYHLSNMLAHELSFFSNSTDYDEFALYSATRLFQRLINKKQFEIDSDESEPKLPQIKSILNYIKKVINPYKFDFELQFKIEDKNLNVISTSYFDLESHICDNASLFDQIEFSMTLGSISNIVKAHLKKIPRKQHDPEWINIYISCMLTLLDSITLSKFMQQKISTSIRTTDKMVDNLYVESRSNDPILFHLPDSMSNYIKILVNELRDVIASELSWQSGVHIPTDVTMKNLMCSLLDEDNE